MSNQQRIPYVIYHGRCMDGFGSAYAAWKLFGNDARYVPMTYGGKMPELRDGTDIYMLDISFRRPIMLELAKTHPHIVVIDHHKTAEADLLDITEEAENIDVLFDMTHSGAFLAWHCFHDEPIPRLLLHIEDRDLWNFTLPDTRAIVAALNTYEFEFDVWDTLMVTPELYGNLVRGGNMLMRAENRQMTQLMDATRVANFNGFLVPAVNAPTWLASMLGHALLKKFPAAPFAATYRDAGTGRRDWSLRSEEGRVDVSEVAKQFGGGGHRNAAGMNEEEGGNDIDFSEHFTYESYAKRMGEEVNEVALDEYT